MLILMMVVWFLPRETDLHIAGGVEKEIDALLAMFFEFEGGGSNHLVYDGGNTTGA